MALYGRHNEQELLARIAAGDEQAFADFFHLYIGILKPFVYSFTKSEAVAEELIQDIFIRIWLARDKLPQVIAPKAWVFKVASNECYHYLRRQLVENKTLDQVKAVHSEATDPIIDYMNVQEVKKLVGEAINSLSSQRKRIYLLSREKGLKIDEIATQLNLSPNTVKNVLVTTAKIIRDYLEKAGYYLPLLLLFPPF